MNRYFGPLFLALALLTLAGCHKSYGLFPAIKNGDVTEIALILDAHPELVSVPNDADRLPLDVAIETDDAEVVKLLLTYRPNVNTTTNGSTPLMDALAHSSVDIAELLLAQGAEVNPWLPQKPPDSVASSAGRWDSKVSPLRASSDYFGSPLHNALSIRDQDLVRIVKLLLAHGAKIDAVDASGETPLFSVINHRPEKPYLPLVHLLLARGADANARGWSGETLLHRAAGRPETVKLLLAHGAKVDARDNFGLTPSHRAALGPDSTVPELLLSHGAEVNARDNEGATPLCLATRKGRQENVEFLLTHGADVNVKDNKGDTPLHAAYSLSHIEVAQILLAHKADPYATNNAGLPPLSGVPLNDGHRHSRY